MGGGKAHEKDIEEIKPLHLLTRSKNLHAIKESGVDNIANLGNQTRRAPNFDVAYCKQCRCLLKKEKRVFQFPLVLI